jgi:hypothetical protein
MRYTERFVRARNFMDIKTIPLSSLEADPGRALSDCADSGQPVIVELADHRLVALQPLPADADDSLIDELLQSNPAFQTLVTKSKAGARKAFVRTAGT